MQHTLWFKLLSTVALTACLSACAPLDPPLSKDTNSAPVAAPGPSRQAMVGQRVTLDGSLSADIDGDLLTYRWSMMRPGPSGAMLSSMTEAVAEFTPDQAGEYILTLIVNDGQVDSAPATVRINVVENTSSNNLPMADAGLNKQVATGTMVTLDGSASSDPDGDILSYSWQVVAIPQGSSSTLQKDKTASPTFMADVEGDYAFRLIVTDGVGSSNPAIVTITATKVAPMNQPPVAKAGNDRSVEVGRRVDLDASGSGDPDGDAITYKWTLTAPGGSASLANNDQLTSSFTPDTAGTYTVTLEISDGKVSAQATIKVTATKDNAAPTAKVGANQSVSPNVPVELDGSQSDDPDNDTLTYLWTLTKPTNSSATLDDPTAQKPKFTPDMEGSYAATLVVNDGEVSSTPATIVVTVAETCVIISEYVEGSSNNKAIEIYNCGGQALDLSRVGVCLSSNAATVCSNTDMLVGMLAANQTYSLCNTSAETALKSKCDTTSATIGFNGDDRLTLFYDNNSDGQYDNNDTILDAFGKIDTQPATKIWSDATFRRCNPAPFKGTGTFSVEDYFSPSEGIDIYDHIGVAPSLGGC